MCMYMYVCLSFFCYFLISQNFPYGKVKGFQLIIHQVMNWPLTETHQKPLDVKMKLLL